MTVAERLPPPVPSRAAAPPPALRRFCSLSALCVVGTVAIIASLRLPAPAVVGAVALLVAALVVSIAGFRAHHGHGRVGAANAVTLVRLGVVAVLAGILFAGATQPVTVLVLGTIALCLDGVDGYLARRQRLTSRFGAAFDMEVDSAFALVLALLAAAGPAGAWAVLLGVPRYAFGAAALAAPWLKGPLADRVSRKVVCVLQLVALLVLQVPFLPPPAALAVVGVTAGLLLWSFASDVVALRHARVPRSKAGRA